MSKKRETNFSPAETELLTNLVREFASVLENKKTDATNNKLKEETWCALAEKFNSLSGVCARDSKALRAKYENIKKTLKRKYSMYRRGLYATGGGPPPNLDLTQDEEIIMELTGPSIEGLPARYDGDEITQSQNAEVKVVSKDVDNDFEPDVMKTDPIKMDGQVTTDPIKMNGQDTIQKQMSKFVLKTPKSTVLRKERNPESFNATMGSYSNVAKKKCQLLDAQIKSIEEKAKQDLIEHELRCQLLNIEIEIKQKLLDK